MSEIRNPKPRNIEALKYVIHGLPEKKFSETKIQKMLYILQETNALPLRYYFNGYERGPISLDLSKDLFKLSVSGIINNIDNKYFEKNEFEEPEMKEEKKADKLFKVLHDSNEVELSVFAKTLEIARNTVRGTHKLDKY